MDKLLQWILENYEILSIPITSFTSWYFTKRHFQSRELKQTDTNIDSSTSDVVSKNLDLYQRMLDDVEARYEERDRKATDRIKQLENKIDELMTEIAKLEKIIRDTK